MDMPTGRLRSERIHRGFRAFLGVGPDERIGPKAFVFASWLVLFIGSYFLFSYVGPRYELLDGDSYFWLIVTMPVLLLISFLIPLSTLADLNRYPLWANIAGRLGFCLPGIFLLAAAVLAANGSLDRTSNSRVVTCLGRRVTLGREKTYYVRVKPWEGSAKEVELDVPLDIYSKCVGGTSLQLTTGNGRFGLEWVRRVEISAPSP
jgi:hypothetical protein